MGKDNIFKRYELKYLLSEERMLELWDLVSKRFVPDRFAHSSIRNIYFDTTDYRLIRRSIEKPNYKEKLRLRSYGTVDDRTEVYAEIKKKHEGIVYKRRIALPYAAALDWLVLREPLREESQISREIDYFYKVYGALRPCVFLSYERDAFVCPECGDLRVTFDRNILFRDKGLSLKQEAFGEEILGTGMVLMELKCRGGLPLWLTGALTELKIFKTSFSKYGEAYVRIYNKNRENNIYA